MQPQAQCDLLTIRCYLSFRLCPELSHVGIRHKLQLFTLETIGLIQMSKPCFFLKVIDYVKNIDNQIR